MDSPGISRAIGLPAAGLWAGRSVGFDPTELDVATQKGMASGKPTHGSQSSNRR
jgi:hypothetical protein